MDCDCFKHFKNKDRYMTTNEGAPITNDTNSLTVGDRGPVLLEDVQLIDKLAHFDRERIPERVVHAKGAGAHGHFVLCNSMRKYTRAKLFTEVDKKTPTFVRFSTVIGSRGSADTLRDPRGFAVKFYTDEGNYDIPGNNLPVFFIRDAIKFPDLIHAFKPSPNTNVIDKNRFWDFVVNSPEATHMITFLFSDKGTVKSYRTMEGFGVNTYVWINEKGRRFYVKYHWKPLAGVKTITRKESEILAGTCPDIATKDLYRTLYNGKHVEYELFVQIMKIEDEKKQNFDPLDATKTWPERKFPLIRVGRLTLTKPPKNFFAEVEQAAFSPSNLIPGIEASRDKLLQGRLFAYHDTQRHRLGTNFHQLPINSARVSVENNEQDGKMRYFARKGCVNYNPNSLNHGNPKVAPSMPSEIDYVCGNVEKKSIPLIDDFCQAGELYRSYTIKERDHLIDNLVNDLYYVDKKIQVKAVINFAKADIEYGERVKRGLLRK